MRKFLAIAATATGGMLAASCVSTPYQSAFNSCESEANACYRLCEEIPDEQGYVRCQRHCDSDIDRCFNYAYEPYRSAYYGGGGYSSPWYGRYGQWYPSSGYYFSFDYYDRYGYRAQRRPGGYGYDGRRDDRRYDDRRYDDRRRDGDGRGGDGRGGDGRDRYQRSRDGGYGGQRGGRSGPAPDSGSQPPPRAPRYTPPPGGAPSQPPQQPTYTPPPSQPQQPSYTPPPQAEPAPRADPPPRAPRGRPPGWKLPGGGGDDATDE